MSYDSEVLADSPVVYLKLTESAGPTAADLGSNATGWTYKSGVTFSGPSIVLGVASSVSDDGTNSTAGSGIATLPAVPAPLASGNDITVELWFDLVADEIAWFAMLGDFSVGVLGLLVSDPTLSFAARTMSAYNSAGVLSAPVAMSLGIHQVVVTVGAGGDRTLYLDGVLAIADTPGLAAGALGGSPSIGGAGPGNLNNCPTTGLKVAAYSAYASALSGTRVAAHYAAGTASASLLRADGHTAVTVTPVVELTASARSDGVTTVSVQALDIVQLDTTQRTVAGIVLTMPTPAIVNGLPTLPANWVTMSSSATGIEGPAHIHAIPDPNPKWDDYTSGWSSLPPPPTAAPWSGRWSVNDLPDPGGYDAGFYWLGDPSGADGTSTIQAGARQWNPDGSTPGAGAWRSSFPFKPSVTAVNHYLQGGGIVHHPKGVNFNSQFIEHMWLKLGADMPQPFTWVMAGMIASFPSNSYVHTLLDAGVEPAARGINMSANDCNTPRTIFDDTPARTVIQATASEAIMATQTGGSILRARVPTKIAPCMFVGIFNGAHSYAGVFQPGSTVLQQGTLNNHPQRYLVMGRQNGWLAQSRASHLLMFEMRCWAHALSRADLDGQYRQLSSTYQFDAYRAR